MTWRAPKTSHRRLLLRVVGRAWAVQPREQPLGVGHGPLGADQRFLGVWTSQVTASHGDSGLSAPQTWQSMAIASGFPVFPTDLNPSFISKWANACNLSSTTRQTLRPRRVRSVHGGSPASPRVPHGTARLVSCLNRQEDPRASSSKVCTARSTKRRALKDVRR